MPAEVGKQLTIGVLALQGSVEEHLESLKACGVRGLAVKGKNDFKNIDGLIIPGGESTTMAKLLRTFDLMDYLRDKINAGLPTWGTCAGMILLAKEIDSETPHLGVMDIRVKRNAYGRQIDSFQKEAIIPALGPDKIPMVFIRAPYIQQVQGNAKILFELEGRIVAARENHMLVTSFHPELTRDKRFHEYFISMVRS